MADNLKLICPRFWFESLYEVGYWAKQIRLDIESKEFQLYQLEAQALELQKEIQDLHAKAERYAREKWSEREIAEAKGIY